MSDYRANLAIAATVIIWGCSYSAIVIALRSIEPIPLAALRFWLAAIPAASWLVVTRQALPKPIDLIRLCAGGIIGMALYNVMLNYGEKTISAGAASFLVNTAPVFTAVLGAIYLRERTAPLQWLGIGISVAGIAMIADGQAGGLRFGAGSSLIIGAAAASAVFFVMQRPLLSRFGAMQCSAVSLIATALGLSPWLPAGFGQIAHAPGAVYAAVGFLGLVAGSLAYGLWFASVGHFGASRATAFLFLVSPAALMVEFLLSGNASGWATICGGLLALCGVALIQISQRRFVRKFSSAVPVVPAQASGTAIME